MQKIFLGFLSLVCSLLVIIGSPTRVAADDIYINVGEATVKKSLLAFPSLHYFGTSPSNKKHIDAGQTLFTTITNDLTVSGFFTFIKPDAFLEETSKTGLKPAPGDPKGFDYKSWTSIGTEFLIRGGYSVSGSKVSFEVYVYHVPRAKLIFGKTYEGGQDAVRKMAHTFSDDVMKALTGKRGMFNTRVVASVQKGGVGSKEIYVMDWDGANSTRISEHKSIALSPAWSPDGKKVAYTAYAYHSKAKTRNADLFMYDLTNGKRFLVSYRAGMNSGANFFPDGRHLLITLSQGGNPDIFKMTADGKSIERITHGPAGSMNVEPNINSDGSKIAFSSDRSGQPMVYTMSTSGGGVKRITFAGKYNASPSWSPDGKKIAFAGYEKGHFDIFVVNADGTGLKRLTDANKPSGKAADNEDPSWSPDGRHIVFTSNRTGMNHLYVVSPDGTNERRLTYDNAAYFKPKWSPYLD